MVAVVGLTLSKGNVSHAGKVSTSSSVSQIRRSLASISASLMVEVTTTIGLRSLKFVTPARKKARAACATTPCALLLPNRCWRTWSVASRQGNSDKAPSGSRLATIRAVHCLFHAASHDCLHSLNSNMYSESVRHDRRRWSLRTQSLPFEGRRLTYAHADPNKVIVPMCCRIDFSPLCPAVEPPCFILIRPGSRSNSSWTTSTRDDCSILAPN